MKRLFSTFLMTMLACLVWAGNLSISRIDSIADVRSAAISAYRKQEPQIAANLYRQSIAMGDSSIIPFYNLACCYGRIGRLDSCKWALKEAIDRGYPDYMEMGMDPDLKLLQDDRETFTALWQKAFMNSYGKVIAKNFDGLLKQSILHKDTANLRLMLPFDKRNSVFMHELGLTVEKTDSLLKFSEVVDAEKLNALCHLDKRQLRYTDNHFVYHDEYVCELPVPYFDKDLAQLLATNSLHMQMRTVDHLYSYLDSLFLVSKQLPLAQTVQLPQLTDSVLALALKIPTDDGDIESYEEKVSRNGKFCSSIFKMLEKSTPIEAKEFEKLNLKRECIHFVRINSLPVRKQFKGLKMAFYNNSKVAIVVVDDHYFFVKGKFKL